MEKVGASERVTSDAIFIVCTVVDNSYEPIIAREF